MPIFVPIGYSTVEIIVQAKELYLKLYIPLVTVRWGEVIGLRPRVFLYQEMKIIVQKKYPKNLQLNQFQNSSNNKKL